MAAARSRRSGAAGTELREALKRRLEVVIICSTDVGKRRLVGSRHRLEVAVGSLGAGTLLSAAVALSATASATDWSAPKAVSPDGGPGQAIVMWAGSIGGQSQAEVATIG